MPSDIELKIKENVVLASFTTFRLGGVAEFFLEVKDKEELMEGIEWAQRKNLLITIFSGGSNVLVSDSGVKGLVIKIDNKGFKLKGDRVEAGAGADLISVSRLANNNNYTGLEWAIGIPGSVGGAVRGNAGAHGQYVANVVETVECYDRDKQMFKFFSNKDCAFDYKDSHFKQSRRLVIWSVIFKLEKGDQSLIRKSVEGNLEFRDRAQPRLASAGCVFKNLRFDYIQEKSPKLAMYILKNNPPKGDKIGVGWIIDVMGLKGRKNGEVKVSLEHANFIVNTGKGTAREVRDLIDYIKKRIYDQFGIEIEEEIEYVGFGS